MAGFYVTNDGASTDEALQELVLGGYNGNVVYCPFNGECAQVAGHLTYTNGILLDDEDLYVATSVQNALFEFEELAPGELSERERLTGGIGWDNIRLTDPYLLVTQHTDLVAFLLHSANPEIHSPFKVVAIHRETGEQQTLFYSNGDLMSGASTGLIADGDLYIGQIFGSFLLKVEDVSL